MGIGFGSGWAVRLTVGIDQFSGHDLRSGCRRWLLRAQEFDLVAALRVVVELFLALVEVVETPILATRLADQLEHYELHLALAPSRPGCRPR